MDLTCLPIIVYMIVTYCELRCHGEYTNFTTLLWIRDSENVDPAVVWFDSTSTYNDATNKTSQTLLNDATTGYRNTLIDTWSSNKPDRIKVSYLNGDAYPLHSEIFNTTGSSISDWFTRDRTTSSSDSDYILNTSFISYNTSFSREDNDCGARRYKAVVLPQYNGTTHFIVYNRDGTNLLPARVLDPSSRCRLSFSGSNPFAFNITVSNLFHEYCSARCRERNDPSGAVHDTFCSCLDIKVSGAAITACNTTCEGDVTQTCGGINPSYPSDSIIFDEVLTEIDTSQFDTPLQDYETVIVKGSIETSYTTTRYIYGYRITLPQTATFPLTLTLTLHFRAENCSSYTLSNTTLEKTFTVDSPIPYQLDLEPNNMQCVSIYLYDTNNTLLTFSVNLTAIAIDANKFVSARILSIEAAWWIEPTEEQCECECWVYNLLYGDSPYNNLTYNEIEDALRNVTEKLERELAVNKSELSSTIRSKTSADDDRPSATAVGYTLGVALLTFSIGGIVLADITKLFGHLHVMRENLMSRFCSKKMSPPDVTITSPSNQTAKFI